MLSYFIAKRYIKSPKSTHAINIISWVTVAVVAFATAAQILVLSVFNGFEDMVQSLYAGFYPDLKIIPVNGKTFTINQAQIDAIKNVKGIKEIAQIVEEKCLLRSEEKQSMVNLKGVDANYNKVLAIDSFVAEGKYNLGPIDSPTLFVGSGLAFDANLIVDDSIYGSSVVQLTMPKQGNISLIDPLSGLSEAYIKTSGSFQIQEEFDNSYAITQINYLRKNLNIDSNQCSAIECKINKDFDEKIIENLEATIFENKVKILTRYQQNTTLYQSLVLEKWAIFAILTLVLIIAAFNMVSALSMLVLEKQKNISILKSMGANNNFIKNIFLLEGLMLGIIGLAIGFCLAIILGFLQIKFHWFKISGSTFLIDYFPVVMKWKDFLLVAFTVIFICIIASWTPANKASKLSISLR